MLAQKTTASPMESWKIELGSGPKDFKIIKGYHDNYNENAELGDLFLMSREGYQHAGVLCSSEDKEIIYFTQKNYSPGLPSNMISWSDHVSKVHVKVFCGGETFAIYRKNGGIPESFRENVRKAMRTEPPYNQLKNSIHFAMKLLEVEANEGEEAPLLQ